MTHLAIKWSPVREYFCIWKYDKLLPLSSVLDVGIRTPGPLIDMIENSPDLVELDLDTSGPILALRTIPHWQPSQVLCNLKNPLSKLRQLRIGGDVDLDWSELTNNPPKACSLYTFFKHHPQLEGVHFDWGHKYNPGISFDPARLFTLFPSLKHFTGPAVMCTALVASQLAVKLETLKIVLEQRNNPSDEPSPSTFEALVNATHTLPSLRELEIVYHDIWNHGKLHLDASALGNLLAATPRLVALTLKLEGLSFSVVSTVLNMTKFQDI
jgi:hypothetical protein